MPYSLLPRASFKMSNEIFIQFHILEKITIGNLNIKYIEFYKVSAVARGTQINYEIGISRPEILVANVSGHLYSLKHIKVLYRTKTVLGTYFYFVSRLL